MTRRAQTVVWTLLKLGVVAAIFGWLISRGAIDWTYFRVGPESLPWAAGGALLIFVSILMTGTRYWTILRANGIEIELPFILKTELAATFFNMCSIGPVGGDIVRSWYVYRHSRDAFVVGASTLADRLFGVYALLLIATGSFLCIGPEQTASPVFDAIRSVAFGATGAGLGFGLSLLLRRCVGRGPSVACLVGMVAGMAAIGHAAAASGAEMRAWWIMAGATALGGGLAYFAVHGVVESGIAALAGRGRVGGHAASVIRALLVVKDHPVSAVKALCLSTVQQSCYILSVFCFAHALALPVFPSLAEIFFATSLTFIMSVVPMPGSGLGISEAAMEFLLVTVSPGAVGGASVYLCFRAWLILVSATGLPFYFSKGRDRA